MADPMKVGRLDPMFAAAIGATAGGIIYGLAGGFAVIDLTQGTTTVNLLFRGVAGALLLAGGALLFAGGALLRNRLIR